jgi:hypothetical protein
MKTAKRFDSVRLKDDIQASLLKEYAGKSDIERSRIIEHDLATSDAPIARFWRRITGQDRAEKVAEDRPAYGRRR